MNKISLYLASVLFFSLVALSTNASAVTAVANGTAGADVTVDCSGTGGAANIVFSPSTNVFIDGQSDTTSFAIFGWHSSVVLKASGQGYGMAGDDNKLAFTDISDAAGYAVLTASQSADGTNAVAAFADWTTI